MAGAAPSGFNTGVPLRAVYVPPVPPVEDEADAPDAEEGSQRQPSCAKHFELHY